MTSKPQIAQFENLEIKKPETVLDWGKTIVFAPHPDDESLGCGGAIALLRHFGLEVLVIVMSDGTLSHPNSNKFPAEKLRLLRETEIVSALTHLSVSAQNVSFLRYRDRSVPDENSTGFEKAVEAVKEKISAFEPLTILVPWRRDPHPDHRATWQIINAAINLLEQKIRMIEYPIWLWELAEENDLPVETEVCQWRLDIKKVVVKKQAAIGEHVSQTTDLIDDDPQGFRLSPEVLQYFATPFEIYLEEKND